MWGSHDKNENNLFLKQNSLSFSVVSSSQTVRGTISSTGLSSFDCASLLRIIYGVISARLCTRILKTWRICLDIELCQLKNGSSSPTSMGTPIFFSSRCNQLIISFAWEKTDLISIAENWINKKNSRYTVVFSILQSVTTSRNLVQIFNQGFSFLSESNLNVYLCPTQCIDCSLMRVLMSPGLQRCYNYWECVLIISIK